MTISEAVRYVEAKLQHLYSNEEALAIARLVVCETSGLQKSELLLHSNRQLSEDETARIYALTEKLCTAEPIQYVLQKTWFYGNEWKINNHVLIPRPETEELVALISDDIKQQSIPHPLVCDIGTGSGCIAISIKKNFPQADVYAVDVSEDALSVAMDNAASLNASVNFFQLNFLDRSKWLALARFDYIVSNPPYVLKTEITSMHANVLQFEPHLALFVQDDDPLIFYRAIAEFGQEHLKNNGKIFVEINEAMGKETAALFAQHGYDNIRLLKDMQGKNRFVTASLQRS